MLPDLDVQLEPPDSRGYRTAQAETLWEAARGKRNRIAPGQPTWRRETSSSEDGLLLALDLVDGSPQRATFWRLGSISTPDR
jgi:hypothetical protein